MTSTVIGVQGVGVSYRTEFAPFQQRLAAAVDCAEVLFEQTFASGVDGIEVLDWDAPLVAHALSFSPARSDFTLDDAAERLFAAARAHGVALLSDHLSFSAVGEYSVPNFFAPARTEAEADRIAANLRVLSARAGMPVAVENAVTFLSDPADELSEVDFVNRVVRTADCGMLLDVNNLYINAVNHHYDPHEYIDRLDGERVAYLHVAGHGEHGPVVVDSHSHDVSDEVWDLLDHAVRRTATAAVILERDNRSATEADLMRELSVMRDIWSRHRR